MKILFSILFSLYVLSIMSAQTASPKSFVVVELFASEGCSSCPPADQIFNEITANAHNQHLPIYTLSFQVDYWNYLGWKDPFSSPQFSERQYLYSQFLPGGVYTPEMIINGCEAFIGSDEKKANELIKHFLAQNPSNQIHLNLVQNGKSLVVNYTVDHLQDNVVINVALVERGLVSHVTAGENKGRTLNHDNVVRVFKIES